MQQLLEALKSFKGVVVVGADQPNPNCWRTLPQEGLGDLLELLRGIERAVTWPPQVCLNLAQRIHKSQVADRPITLTQGLHRRWGRTRRREIADWSAQRTQYWDKVVRGSSSLRAALIRQ
eukprot:3307266-Pyramimonas_sp.AAC.1